MTVTRTWTDPSEGGPMDRDTGQTIREQDYDAILSNLLVLGGTNGSEATKYNLLTNGGFDVWQRGNGPFTATNAYTADRWAIGLAGTDTLSVSRDSANADVGGGYCAACTFTLGTGAGSSNLTEFVKTADNYMIASRVLSASVRVKTSTANAVRLGLYTGSAFVYGAFHSGGGAYETLTVTATMAASGPITQLSVFFAATSTAYIDNAMLVIGSTPATYAPLHPADELARCQRYYEVFGDGLNDMAVSTYQAATGTVQIPQHFRVTKAITPTLTRNGTWTVLNCGQPSPSGPSIGGFYISVTATALGQVAFANSSAGQNIVAEANP